LLDAVRAIAPAPEEDFLTYPSTFNPLPAANDNQLAWDHSVSGGWNAVC
jgi:hypothetical protein